jgi:hypothetical protein
MSQSVGQRTIATKAMLAKIRAPRPVTAPSFVMSRRAIGFERRWQLRSGGTRR